VLMAKMIVAVLIPTVVWQLVEILWTIGRLRALIGPTFGGLMGGWLAGLMFLRVGLPWLICMAVAGYIVSERRYLRYGEVAMVGGIGGVCALVLTLVMTVGWALPYAAGAALIRGHGAMMLWALFKGTVYAGAKGAVFAVVAVPLAKVLPPKAAER